MTKVIMGHARTNPGTTLWITADLQDGQGLRKLRASLRNDQHDLVTVDSGGLTYWLAPTYPRSRFNSDPQWRFVDSPEPSRRARSAASKTMLDEDTKARIEELILRGLEDFGRNGASVSLLESDVFDNRYGPYVRSRTSAIQSALNRLIKAGKVEMLYAAGAKRDEVKTYYLMGVLR